MFDDVYTALQRCHRQAPSPCGHERTVLVHGLARSGNVQQQSEAETYRLPAPREMILQMTNKGDGQELVTTQVPLSRRPCEIRRTLCQQTLCPYRTPQRLALTWMFYCWAHELRRLSTALVAQIIEVTSFNGGPSKSSHRDSESMHAGMTENVVIRKRVTPKS